ncbi:MAG: hypothetical protein IKM97_06295 [Clostridia bacterium]|nr:hypothetical protein [Clostridia bacterium]
MDKKKKITLVTIIIISLILIIVAGYTFSKYFSSVPGKATAQIAAWSFNANAGDENKQLTAIILEPSNGEKIAPGTNGEFQIKVDSIGSDVDVDYSVNISQENLPANMKFNIAGETQEYSTMAALANAKLHGTLDSSNSQQNLYTIEWNWPFETLGDGNIVDNSKDMAALNLTDVGFQIEVIGEQAE